MCVQLVLQLDFHEINSIESRLIFNRTKDLDNNYLNHFNVFKKIMVEDSGCRNFVLKPRFKSLFFCKISSRL